MHINVLAGCLWISITCNAAEVATRKTNAPSHETQVKYSVQQFYAPRTPENPGRPEWPAKLHFESVKDLSIKDFVATLQGSWMPLFQCRGRAVTAKELEAAGIWDGIKNKGVAYSYKGLTATQRLISPATSLKRQKTQTKTGPVDIEALGENRFKISFHGNIDSIPAIYQLGHVRETGETVLQGEDENESDNGHCENGETITGFLVPVPAS